MPHSFDFDLAIIGSGPAGATLARLADSDLRTVIIDKKTDKPGGFQKPCGGLLAPDAQKALSRYDITLPKEVLVDPQIFSVKTMDLRSGITRHYQRCYINMNRHKFDMWLNGMIPDRISRISGLCRDVSPIPGGYEITYTQNGSTSALPPNILPAQTAQSPSFGKSSFRIKSCAAIPPFSNGSFALSKRRFIPAYLIRIPATAARGQYQRTDISYSAVLSLWISPVTGLKRKNKSS